jgi:hypothetical protein
MNLLRGLLPILEISLSSALPTTTDVLQFTGFLTKLFSIDAQLCDKSYE